MLLGFSRMGGCLESWADGSNMFSRCLAAAANELCSVNWADDSILYSS